MENEVKIPRVDILKQNLTLKQEKIQRLLKEIAFLELAIQKEELKN